MNLYELGKGTLFGIYLIGAGIVYLVLLLLIRKGYCSWLGNDYDERGIFYPGKADASDAFLFAASWPFVLPSFVMVALAFSLIHLGGCITKPRKRTMTEGAL